MKKNIFFFILMFVFLFSGCESKKEYAKIEIGTNVVFQQDFNNETYVWEGLFFPTNRVMK